MGVMKDLLRPFIRDSVIVFLDDILIFSKYWKESLRHLDDVLSTFEREQLYCKARKRLFATDSVRFLGHIVTGDTFCPDLGKLQAVINWPVPSSVKEVRQFFCWFRQLSSLLTLIFPLQWSPTLMMWHLVVSYFKKTETMPGIRSPTEAGGQERKEECKYMAMERETMAVRMHCMAGNCIFQAFLSRHG